MVDMKQDASTKMLNQKSKNMKFRRIPYDEIIGNPNNTFSMDDEELMLLKQSIDSNGLFSPLTVMELSENKYMLLSGHRRFEVLKQLIEDNEREDLLEIPCMIKNDVKLNRHEMRTALRTANCCRNQTREEKLLHVKEAEEDYEVFKQEGKIPVGKPKRDWIAENTGYSARSVQDYLNILHKENDEPKKEVNEKSSYGYIKDEMEKKLKTKVQVTNKKIVIHYNKGEEELHRILESLGIEYEELGN